MNSDTFATAPQNTLEVDGPEQRPARTRGLSPRVPSMTVNGSRHTVLVLGPVGPLLKPASRWPQWPRKLSHPNGPVLGGTLGSTIGRGRVVISGLVVWSQPTPEPFWPLSSHNAEL